MVVDVDSDGLTGPAFDYGSDDDSNAEGGDSDKSDSS